MVYPQLTPRCTPSAGVEKISGEDSHYRLSIPAGFSDSYRLAQLDNYPNLPRKKFPHHSLTLSLSARASSDSIAGTWGFGLWNDPFGISLGFGGSPFRLPMLPNAVWFFGASKENYLSFKDASTRPPTNGGSAPPSGTSQREVAANGFIAQTFRSPKFHPWLILAGLALPFSRKMARKLLGKVIEEDGVQLWNQGARSRSATNKLKSHQHTLSGTRAGGVQSLSVDPTQWHKYRLDWSLKRVLFEVDEEPVFESLVSPNPPLGLVIWIDNQYAAFTPEGKIAMGVLEGKEAWLEIKDLEIKTPPRTAA